MKVVKSRAFKDRLKGHKEAIIALCSPYGRDGYLLLSASKDGSIRAWDLVKRTITNRLLLSRNPQKSLTFSIQENMTQTEKKNELRRQQEITVKDQLSAAAFSATHVFAGFDDGFVSAWNMTDLSQQVSFIGHEKRINEICVGTDKLVTGSSDSTVRVWDLKTGEGEVVFKVTGQVNKLVLIGDIAHALVQRNILYSLDIQKQQIVRCTKFPHSFTCFIILQNNFYAGTIENSFLVYNLEEIEPDKKLMPVKLVEGLGGWILQIKQVDEYLFCGCDDLKIKVFKLPTIELQEQLTGHDDGIIAIEFADKMLYSGSYDNSIRSWDIKEMVSRIRERKNMVWEDLESKKYQVYYKIAFKGKKKAAPKKK